MKALVTKPSPNQTLAQVSPEKPPRMTSSSTSARWSGPADLGWTGLSA